ncbi:MAG: DUF3883 domain-containing protein [Candidatus Binataceae bacterium]
MAREIANPDEGRSRPRLIERAFPLKQASPDSVHEKNVRHGHISTLHIWPARPPLARAAGLTDNPGFDILSNRPAFGASSAKSTVFEERAIEVKGRAGGGDIALTENEWSRACKERGRYWLYVVYNCGTPNPRLLRVQDPFRKLIATAKGGVIVDETEVLRAADAG